MKKTLAITLLFITTIVNAQTTFTGNAATGFGGTIGQSSLTISDNGTTINFSLTKGTGGGFNDVMVMYIDSKTGGFANTASMNDQIDNNRKAISGASGGSVSLDPVNRSTVNFPSGFLPDYAISLDPNSGTSAFGGLWSLANGGDNSLVFVSSANLTPLNSTSANYTFNCTKANLGITATNVTFKFVITYLNYNNSFRSNEGYGAGLPATNVGAGTGTAPTTANFTSSLTYPGPLPVTLSSFKAMIEGQQVKLFWDTKSENNTSSFAIERSDNGINFTNIGTVTATNIPTGAAYSFIHTTPAQSNLYRLKMMDKDGKYTYSNTVSINLKNRTASIVVYPTITKSNINIKIKQEVAGDVQITVISNDGKIVQQQKINVPVGDVVLQHQLPNNLMPGMYVVKVANQSFSIMVQ